MLLTLCACAGVLVLLSSARLLASAQELPPGASRDLLLATAEGLHGAAHLFALDRPMSWIDGLTSAAGGESTATLEITAAATSPELVAAATLRPRTDASPSPSAAPVSATVPAALSVASALLPDPLPRTLPTPTPPAAATASPASTTTLASLPTYAPSPTIALPTPTPATTLTVQTPTLSPTPSRQISAAEPLLLYSAGDSFVEWLGYALDEFAARDGLLAPRMEFRLSSGLTNPTYFDWPAHLRAALAAPPSPDVVILFLGANDDRGMTTEQGVVPLGSPEWSAEYRRRSALLMDLAGSGGARLYWVTLPSMREPRRQSAADASNAALLVEAASRPWVRVVDIRPLFVDGQGRYATYLSAPGGEVTRARQADGVHLTRAGTDWVADLVYRQLQADWGFSLPLAMP